MGTAALWESFNTLWAQAIHTYSTRESNLKNKRPGKKRASRRESKISKVNTQLTPSREAISHNTLGVVTSRRLKRASICVRQLMRNVVRHSFNLLPSPWRIVFWIIILHCLVAQSLLRCRADGSISVAQVLQIMRSMKLMWMTLKQSLRRRKEELHS